MKKTTQTRNVLAGVILAIAVSVGAAGSASAYSDYTTVLNAAPRNISDGGCLASAWSAGSSAYTNCTSSTACDYIRVRGYIVSGGTGYYSSWVSNYSPTTNTQVTTGMISGLSSGYHRLEN